MRLILNGINGHYLRDITINHACQIKKVVAAVAYATNDLLLFDWCFKNEIPLVFYGRLDQNIAVNVRILEKFLSKKSPKFTCRLVQHHHAKVIRWYGVGVYIGSANLTDSAWIKNIEAGCFFFEDEITDEMSNDIEGLFDRLHEQSTPLSDELFKLMKERQKIVNKMLLSSPEFWENPFIKKWDGLVYTSPIKAKEKARKKFLEEWYSTLQDIRDIGNIVSQKNNRPSWISEGVPSCVQADQFLHAHYYNRTFDGKTAKFEEYYEKNKDQKETALSEAIKWWRELPEAPTGEDNALNVVAPFIKEALSEKNLENLDLEKFKQIYRFINAGIEFAKRVTNSRINLPSEGNRYPVEVKIDALATKVWNSVSRKGLSTKEVIAFILYGGASETLPERIWLAYDDPKWKIECVGISTLGELTGWALPDLFPPRNGRTSKSLRSLGYDVIVHTS